MSHNKRPLITSRSILTILVALHLLYKVSCFGKVYPERVVKLVNSSVDVFCTIDLEQSGGLNSSHLSFVKGNVRIPNDQITIINSTSIKWHLHRATENDTKRYDCLLDGEGVGITNVYIGYMPKKVTDFKCRSDNWQNMTCTFTKPWNPIPTAYHLYYVSNIITRYRYECPLPYIDEGPLECAIPHQKYRQTHDFFTFYLSITHDLQNLTQEFVINNFEVIVPAPPENISFSHVTSKSVTIHWKLSYKLELLHKNHHVNFIHDVRILSEFENTNDNQTEWQFIKPHLVRKQETGDQTLMYYVELHNLKYANSWYDVRIRVRTDKSKNTDEMYSEVSSLGFRTEPRTPDRPPSIDQGGFFINDDNDVYIFWEELQKSERNGPNASYDITEVRENGRIINHRPIEITNTMAKFNKIDTHSTYEFVVKSINSLGASERGSTIRVPARRDRLHHPINLKKLSQDGVYNLSWLSPTKDTSTTFTVFWCKPKNSLPNACEGEFKFERVPYSKRNFNLTTSSSINFAVSTNNNISSSGMIWAMCTAAQSSDIGKIKTIWITRTGSSFMEIQWKLDCMYDSIVKGYVIKYCPIKDPKTLECKDGGLRNITINSTINNYTITHLKPYTTYKIVLTMFSATRHGPDSDPLQNTTLEAAPSAPQEFKAYDVRNTSMKLEWKKPKDINGVLMFYKIFYNGKRLDVYNVANDTTKEPFEKMTYLLTNLTSYTNYELLVQACTAYCSENSNKEHKVTEIGVPGSINQPSSTTLNDMGVQIGWSEPRIKSGHIDYYELRTLYKDQSGVVAYESNVKIGGKHRSCKRPPPCTSTGNIYSIEYYIRPVNVIRSPHEKFLDTSTAQVMLKSYETTYNNNRIDSDIVAQPYIDTSTTKHPVRHHHQNCELNDTELLRWLDLDPYSEHLPGEWSKPSITNCLHVGGIDAKTIVTIICSIVTIVTMFTVGYKFYQKIKDMKNIVIVLPPGLEDITKEVKPENLESNRKAKPGIIMDNFGLFADDEEDRLLRRRAESDSSGRSQTDESHSQGDLHEDGLDDHTFDAEKLVDDDSNSNNSIPTDSAFEVSPKSFDVANTIQPITTPILTSTPQQQTRPIMSGGYVKPNTMMRPSDSGYIHHMVMPSAVRPSPSNSSDYVPVNQFGRPTMNAIPPENTTDLNNVKVSLKTPIVAQTDSNGISGYVTHKQLSDFGHRMQ